MFTFELRRNVSDADFLLFLGDFVDEKYEIAGLYLRGQRDQRASRVYEDRGGVLMERRQGNRRVTGVDDNRGNVLMECAGRLAPSADQHGHMQRLALACPSTFCLRRWRRGLWLRLVANCRTLLGCFDGEFALRAVQLAFKAPRREENLLEGFGAVVEDDPAFAVTIRAAQPDSVVLRHGCPLQFRPILHGAREDAMKDCGSGVCLFHAVFQQFLGCGWQHSVPTGHPTLVCEVRTLPVATWLPLWVRVLGSKLSMWVRVRCSKR